MNLEDRNNQYSLFMFSSYTLKQLIKVCKAFVGLLLQTSRPVTADAAVQLVGGEICAPVTTFPRGWGIYHRLIKILSVRDTKRTLGSPVAYRI